VLPMCVSSTFSVLIGFAVCANCPGDSPRGMQAIPGLEAGGRVVGLGAVPVRYEEISNPPLSVHSRGLYPPMQHVRTASMQSRRPNNSQSWGFPRRMPAGSPPNPARATRFTGPILFRRSNWQACAYLQSAWRSDGPQRRRPCRR